MPAINDAEQDDQTFGSSPGPPKKRRKLRSFSRETEAAPLQLPGNRVRAVPHVVGQFAAHIYLELDLPPSLSLLLHSAITSATGLVNSELHSMLNGDSLHISLSRPLYLRAGQRSRLLEALKGVVNNIKSAQIAFARFTSLINDDETRAFLAVEVGTGYEILQHLTTAIDERLHNLHLPTYYDPPIFHASIAWLIPSQGNHEDRALPPPIESTHKKNSQYSAKHTNATSDTLSRVLQPAMIDFINQSHGMELRRETIQPKCLTCKIGQEVYRL